jgi:hypothetical protein
MKITAHFLLQELQQLERLGRRLASARETQENRTEFRRIARLSDEQVRAELDARGGRDDPRNQALGAPQLLNRSRTPV